MIDLPVARELRYVRDIFETRNWHLSTYIYTRLCIIPGLKITLAITFPASKKSRNVTVKRSLARSLADWFTLHRRRRRHGWMETSRREASTIRIATVLTDRFAPFSSTLAAHGKYARHITQGLRLFLSLIYVGDSVCRVDIRTRRCNKRVNFPTRLFRVTRCGARARTNIYSQ